MVEIKSPVRLKDIEGKAGISFKALLGIGGSRKEFYESDRLLIITLDKGECIAFLDRDEMFGSCRETPKDGTISED
jgi:hypothetical protein